MKNGRVVKSILVVVLGFFVGLGCGDDSSPPLSNNTEDPCERDNPPPSCRFQNMDAGSDMSENEADMGGEDCVPGTEICDGEDNDCDGEVDENFTLGEVCEEGTGACLNTGETICNEAGDAVTCSVTAGDPDAEEVCDGQDNDCDGDVDEGFDTLGDECMAGMGECLNTGEIVCSEDGTGVVCGVMPLPKPEATEATCDDLDNDCDGEVDEGCDDDGDDYCEESFTTVGTPAVCPNGGGDCNDMQDVAFPGGTEVCDTYDNDCSGRADDGASDALTYYIDCDGDGFAASTGGSRTQCSPPSDTAASTACGGAADATWTTTLPSNQDNTDCQDDNADVFPGQTTYFETPYTTSGLATSFDYNCDGNLTRGITATSISSTDPCNSTSCTLFVVTDPCGAAGWSQSFVPPCGIEGDYTACGSPTGSGCMSPFRRCTGGSRMNSRRAQICR